MTLPLMEGIYYFIIPNIVARQQREKREKNDKKPADRIDAEKTVCYANVEETDKGFPLPDSRKEERKCRFKHCSLSGVQYV